MPNEHYILSIDQSTNVTKVMLFDEKGSLFAKVERPHRQIITKEGWIEHDPDEIYRNMLDGIREVLAKSGVHPSQVLAAGLCNQRETAVVWARNGKPLCNAVVWKCARGREICRQLHEYGYEPLIKKRTGLRLSPYFSAAKFHWMLHNVPLVQKYAERGTLMAGTMDSFLIYRLTHRHATDYSNASRTQLFDIHNLQWDSEICKMFDLPLSMLPHVRYSDSIFGKTTFEGIFDTPILLCGVMGDAHAALFAQRCIHAGMGKISYGDGASVMINTGLHPVLSDDLSVSLAWGMEKKIQYVLEGNVNYAGALLDWMAANLELAPDREHILALAHQVSDSDGVYLIPAFSGLGAPYWNSSVRAQLSGMTLNTRKCHISCAAEQSIAYQVTDVIRAARAVFSGIKTLRADSSLAQDAPLLQFQSDLLRTPITASAMPESPGAGVAFTVGLTVGLYTPEQLENTCSAKRYEPQMRDTQVAALYAGWCNAVSHMLSQPTT